MKKFNRLLLLVVVCLVLPIQMLLAQRPTTLIESQDRTIEVFTDHIEVLFDYHRQMGPVAAKLSIDTTRIKFHDPGKGYASIYLSEGAGIKDVYTLLRKVRGLPEINKAGLSLVVRGGAIMPSDNLYPSQYGPPITEMDRAWEITQGSSGVVVGVIDSGIPLQEGTSNLSHEDLNNSSRIIQGENFSRDDDDVGVRDLLGHGTHVTGILSAESNNNLGIAGGS